jgi:hypothetical protein
MRAISRQQAVVGFPVRVEAKERQVEKPVNVWTRSSDAECVRLILTLESCVVAIYTTVGVAGVEEIVIGETFVESQFHRVVETFRQR